MSILLTKAPPASGPRAVGLALRDLLGRPDPRDLSGGGDINLSQPLPVYRLALEDIGDVAPFDRAEPVGWRYIIESAGGRAAYADVRESGGGQAKFASLSRNLNADRLIEAAHIAQHVASTLPSDCDARILDVPSLYISAFWLNGETSVFIPYIDADRLSKPDAKIDVDPRFVPRLRELARMALSHAPLQAPSASPF